MTIRMVVAVVLVVITSLALQVPQLAFSAFFVLFVSKENRVLTTLTGVVMIAGTTTATVVTLLLDNFTFDYPELRIPVMAAFVFTGMFLSRTFVIGPLGFVIGFFSALMQTVTESAPNADVLLRSQLWLWIAVVYPIALTVFVNQVFLPAHPWTALVQSLTLRLDLTTAAVERAVRERSAGGHNNRAVLDVATRGGAIMAGLLNFAEEQDFQIKRRHPLLVETIAAATHLVSATVALEFRERVPLSENDLLCARTLLADLAQLKKMLPEKNLVLEPREPVACQAVLPQLRELQFAVESFRDSLVKGASDFSSMNAPKARKPLFAADAFTNPSHVKFALRVTLAAMLTYIIYSGLAWPGISTAFITCCFVALGNTGATIYKSWLRFIGCAVGALLGYLAICLLVPHMESIVSLVLLTASATGLFGWVAAGSERIAYAGLQAAFAFYLCVFQGFEPGSNLTIARDRMIGIIIGTILSALAFRYIWPEHAADSLRVALRQVLGDVAKLLRMPKPGSAEQIDGKAAVALHQALAKDLDNILLLSEQAAVEDAVFSHPRRIPPAVRERMIAHIQALCVMATGLLRRTKVEEWQRLDASAQTSEAALRGAISDHLQNLSAFIGGGRRPDLDKVESALTTWDATVANVSGNDRPRLVRRLVGQTRELI